MTDTIINAADRFVARSDRPKQTVIDALRVTGRVPLSDRALLAERLGQVAARLDPERPARAARRWFEHAWHGDRWAKRKRLVILPGETPHDPQNEGAYVASGADWAVLIEQAVQTQHPGQDPTSLSDRSRAARDLLRGTSFLPSLAPIPLHGDSAQALVASYAERLASTIGEGSAIRRLWSMLAAAPFKIGLELSDAEPTVPEALRPVAARAAEAAIGQYRMDGTYRYEFISDPTAEHQGWAHPIARLGLRAHRRHSRIFVVPQSVLHPDAEGDDETSPEELVSAWLVAEGLLSGEEAYEDLPEISYDAGKGYGWQSFPYDIVQSVHIEARPKGDGTIGLWVSAHVSEMDHYHPFTIGRDTAAVEAGRTGWLDFIGMPMDYHGPASSYVLINWPVYDRKFMNGDALPYGAVSGLIETDDRDFTDVEGWIDDTENAEVQDLLFGIKPNVRFLPSVTIDPHTPSPCSEQTIASAFFKNLPVGVEERIGQRLLEQADRFAQAGLAYHDAVLAHHRALIDGMASE